MQKEGQRRAVWWPLLAELLALSDRENSDDFHRDEDKEAVVNLAEVRGTKVKPDRSSGQSQLLELVIQGLMVGKKTIIETFK